MVGALRLDEAIGRRREEAQGGGSLVAQGQPQAPAPHRAQRGGAADRWVRPPRGSQPLPERAINMLDEWPDFLHGWDEPRIDPDGEMHGFGCRWYARDGTPLTNMRQINKLLGNRAYKVV